MECPYCPSKKTLVVDKRNVANKSVRRRRKCPRCKKRFTTYEKMEPLALRVIKKDGTRERFDREKIRMGIVKSCEKRPVPDEKIDLVVKEIESKLMEGGKREVKTKTIGDLVMRKLKKLDKVAYIRFASVYREFTDLDSFQHELKKLLKK
jgi:transcriptional repressor NrdR